MGVWLGVPASPIPTSPLLASPRAAPAASARRCWVQPNLRSASACDRFVFRQSKVYGGRQKAGIFSFQSLRASEIFSRKLWKLLSQAFDTPNRFASLASAE